ncbi:AAA domain-containing protein, partial [bacterium]|nr:AAA domain-containing protein [bacterium]
HQDDIIGGVETFRDLSQVEELQKELKQTFQLGDIISKNHKIQELFSILPDIAISGSNVLITGESGTGKELFARAIHDLSNRKDKPFIAVNCGALQDSLLESELFGYKAGAFTGAKHDKPGRFALAEGGTLFLDEIGDISPALQVRLLRVLQEKMYDPLGSTHSVKADARIITATNKDVSGLVEQGTFREDLYYRVNVMKIDLPPLRERKEDIPFLVDHFINRFNRIFNKEISTLAPDTLGILVGHDYPGNIRELENIMEHAFVLCSGSKIEPRHLPGFLHPASVSHSNSQPTQKAATMHEVEKQLILDTLQRNNWNRKSTADELGIHKSTLFRKIQKLGIELPQFDGRYTRK